MPLAEEKILDYISTPEVASTDPERYKAVKTKMGLDTQDLAAWRWAKQNPNNPDAALFRNNIFSKLAENEVPTNPNKGLDFSNRFLIKFFGDEKNTRDISSFLREKGYQTRVKDGTIQLKRPNDPEYYGIVPVRDIDFFSLGDWSVARKLQRVSDASREIVEIGVGSIADLAKIGGTVGGLITGAFFGGVPGAMLGATAGAGASAAVSGGVMGGLETLRQQGAKALGLQPNLNHEKIQEAAKYGALVPAATRIIGGVIKYPLKKLAGNVTLKPNSKEIVKAGKDLGVEVTPAQLTDNRTVHKIEENLTKGGGLNVGSYVTGLPKTVDKNIQAVKTAAEEIVAERSLADGVEIGKEISKDLVKAVEQKIAPAAEIYKKWEGMFPHIAPELEEMKAVFRNLKDRYKFDDEVLKTISKQESKLVDIKNLDDLKKFRTDTGRIFVKERLNGAASEIYKEATATRARTLIHAAEDSGKNVYAKAKKEIEFADSLYAKTAKEVETLIGKDKLRLGPLAETKKFTKNLLPIDASKELINTRDPDRILAIKKAFPDVYEKARTQKIEDLAKKLEEMKEVNFPARLSKEIDKMTPAARTLIFGDKAAEKAASLKIVLQSLPAPFNASNTQNMAEFMKYASPLSQGKSFGTALLYELITNPKSSNASKLLGMATRATATGVTKQKIVEKK